MDSFTRIVPKGQNTILGVSHRLLSPNLSKPLVSLVCIGITHAQGLDCLDIRLPSPRPLLVEHEGKTMPDQCTDTSACAAITEEEIAKRAYELWESRGCPLGNGESDWQTARKQLLTESRHSLEKAAHAGIDLTLAPTPGAHRESGLTMRRGFLSRWMGLLRNAG